MAKSRTYKSDARDEPIGFRQPSKRDKGFGQPVGTRGKAPGWTGFETSVSHRKAWPCGGCLKDAVAIQARKDRLIRPGWSFTSILSSHH